MWMFDRIPLDLVFVFFHYYFFLFIYFLILLIPVKRVLQLDPYFLDFIRVGPFTFPPAWVMICELFCTADSDVSNCYLGAVLFKLSFFSQSPDSSFILEIFLYYVSETRDLGEPRISALIERLSEISGKSC